MWFTSNSADPDNVSAGHSMDHMRTDDATHDGSERSLLRDTPKSMVIDMEEVEIDKETLVNMASNDENANRKSIGQETHVSDFGSERSGSISRSGPLRQDSSVSIGGENSKLTLSKRRGSQHVFTVLNYGNKPIEECPPSVLTPNLAWEHPNFPTLLETLPESLQESIREPDNIFIPNQDDSVSDNSVEKFRHRVNFHDKVHHENGNHDSLASAGTATKPLTLVDVLRRGRLFASRKQKRLVLKDGEVNFSNAHVHKKHLSYFFDLFTTLLDLKWRYVFFIFILTFLLTWLIFGFIWWCFVLAARNSKKNTENISTCLVGVDNFASALLFSIETQQTIGYGTRAVTDECPLAIMLVMIQSLLGVLLSCVMTGLIFGKFSRPRSRAETIIFSKKAVICERDGVRCLMFRVGDMRRTHLAGVSIRALLIQRYLTAENEEIPFYQHNLHVETESEDFFFLAWPIKCIHKIDESSPLWNLCSEDIIEADFEVVVVLEGTNQTTGQSTQVRTSYLPTEILWGHRLTKLITSLNQRNKYQVNYARFHDTDPVLMSEKCAHDFDSQKHLKHRIEKKLGLKPLTQ